MHALQSAHRRLRCLKANKPTNYTAVCVACVGCSTGQYISWSCNWSTFYDARVCVSCRYGSTVVLSNGSTVVNGKAIQSCSAGSFVINECTSGTDVVDA